MSDIVILGEWRPLKRSCGNCLQPIMGRPYIVKGQICITGFEPMEYIHANGKAECPPETRLAQPYSDCGAKDEWNNANTEANQ